MDSQLLLFSELFPNLRHLELHDIRIGNCFSSSDFGVRSEDLMAFASAHPSQVELKLPQFRFTAADAIIFICRFDSLKWF